MGLLSADLKAQASAISRFCPSRGWWPETYDAEFFQVRAHKEDDDYWFVVVYEEEDGWWYCPDFQTVMQWVGTEENFEQLQDWYAMLLEI